jgi:tetratricopeptide (TPR) repeat protein
MTTRPAWVLLVWLAAVPATLNASSGGATIKALKVRFDAGEYHAVISALDPDGLQKLRGQDLARGYVLLGASYEKIGRADKTLSLYQLGAALFPRDQDLLARLAQLLHKSGLEEQARPLYEKILKVNSVNPYAHWGLGQIDRSLGFLDRAAEHYEKALEDFSDRSEIWLEYTELLYSAREWKTAELAARRTLALEPKSRPAALTLALILRALGRIDEALDALPPAPVGDPEILRARALWLWEAGRPKQSADAAAALLRQMPDDPVGRYLEARAALAAGRRLEALSDLERGARADSGFASRFCARLASQIRAR